jgi:hypothetical protein
MMRLLGTFAVIWLAVTPAAALSLRPVHFELTGFDSAHISVQAFGLDTHEERILQDEVRRLLLASGVQQDRASSLELAVRIDLEDAGACSDDVVLHVVLEILENVDVHRNHGPVSVMAATWRESTIVTTTRSTAGAVASDEALSLVKRLVDARSYSFQALEAQQAKSAEMPPN